jgi:hypothetical protein
MQPPVQFYFWNDDSISVPHLVSNDPASDLAMDRTVWHTSRDVTTHPILFWNDDSISVPHLVSNDPASDLAMDRTVWHTSWDVTIRPILFLE